MDLSKKKLLKKAVTDRYRKHILDFLNKSKESLDKTGQDEVSLFLFRYNPIGLSEWKRFFILKLVDDYENGWIPFIEHREHQANKDENMTLINFNEWEGESNLQEVAEHFIKFIVDEIREQDQKQIINLLT